jgi:hypothetical protein
MTSQEEAYALTRAYVPEHIVSLMTLISKGDPFLIEDHLGLARDNWLILVGYPLEKQYSRADIETGRRRIPTGISPVHRT